MNRFDFLSGSEIPAQPDPPITLGDLLGYAALHGIGPTTPLMIAGHYLSQTVHFRTETYDGPYVEARFMPVQESRDCLWLANLGQIIQDHAPFLTIPMAFEDDYGIYDIIGVYHDDGRLILRIPDR